MAFVSFRVACLVAVLVFVATAQDTPAPMTGTPTTQPPMTETPTTVPATAPPTCPGGGCPPQETTLPPATTAPPATCPHGGCPPQETQPPAETCPHGGCPPKETQPPAETCPHGGCPPTETQPPAETCPYGDCPPKETTPPATCPDGGCPPAPPKEICTVEANCTAEYTNCVAANETSCRCLCKRGYGGPTCNECAPQYYGFPNCTRCRPDGRCPSALCEENNLGKSVATCDLGGDQSWGSVDDDEDDWEGECCPEPEPKPAQEDTMPTYGNMQPQQAPVQEEKKTCNKCEHKKKRCPDDGNKPYQLKDKTCDSDDWDATTCVKNATLAKELRATQCVNFTCEKINASCCTNCLGKLRCGSAATCGPHNLPNGSVCVTSVWSNLFRVCIPKQAMCVLPTAPPTTPPYTSANPAPPPATCPAGGCPPQATTQPATCPAGGCPPPPAYTTKPNTMPMPMPAPTTDTSYSSSAQTSGQVSAEASTSRGGAHFEAGVIVAIVIGCVASVVIAVVIVGVALRRHRLASEARRNDATAPDATGAPRV